MRLNRPGLCWAPTRTRIRTRRRIGLGLVLESGLPTEGEIRLTSGFHNLASKERKDEVIEKETRMAERVRLWAKIGSGEGRT
jgi:hypothetical protein